MARVLATGRGRTGIVVQCTWCQGTFEAKFPGLSRDIVDKLYETYREGEVINLTCPHCELHKRDK